MYTNAALYNCSSNINKKRAEQVLEKFFHLLTWKEGERIVDAGSGSGNVTTQILAPKLPEDFKELVGLDISEHMVKYANNNNKDHRITFVTANLAEPDFRKLEEAFSMRNMAVGFDKVFSFNCLHWIKDQEQCVKNLYSLLRRGGQVLIMFVARAVHSDMWNEAAFSEKWLPYTKTADRFKFHYQDSEDIDGDVTKLMSDAGFVVHACIHYEEYFDYSGPAGLGLMETVNPFPNYIPEDLRSEYVQDAMQIAHRYQEKYEGRGIPFTEVCVVASKPE